MDGVVRENHSRGLPPKDAKIREFTRTLMRKTRIGDASVKALPALRGRRVHPARARHRRRPHG